jgi:hypothetical protein
MSNKLIIGDDLPTFSFNLQKPLGTDLIMAAADTVHFSFIKQLDDSEIYNVQCTSILGGSTTWRATPPANALDGLDEGQYYGVIYILIGGTTRQTWTKTEKFVALKKRSTT